MKFRIGGSLLAISIAIACSPVCSRAAQQGLMVNGQGTGASQACRVYINDGMSNKQIPGRIGTTGRDTTTWASSDKSLNAEIKSSQLSQATVYRVKVSAAKDDGIYHLIRLSIAVPIDKYGTDSSFWDGWEERSWDGASTMDRDSIDGTFPVSCISQGKQGLALGITPDNILSSLRPGIRGGDSGRELFYETKIVVDTKHPQTVNFVVYPFSSNFGYLDAVQAYYDLYPKWFEPTAGVDSRIYGVGGYMSSSGSTHRLQLNSIRRTKQNWEWWYAPYVRCGEWYPEKADWRQGQDIIHRYKSLRDDYKGTWEEYHNFQTREAEYGDKTCGMFYYIFVYSANNDLMKQYPEANMINKSGQLIEGGQGEFLDQADANCSFPYGTGLAAKQEDDIRKIVDNYDISGFAFDMANHCDDDYSPAQLKFGVGRTFDEEGKIFSTNPVVAVFMADRIHKLSRNGKRMGVIANEAISNTNCFSVFHSDALMYENNPNRNPANLMALKLQSGRKPLTFWGSLEGGRGNGGIRWEYMSDPESANKIMTGLAQNTLLTALRIGATPMNWSAQPVGLSWLPTLIELKRAGWNPAPAVQSTDKKLWIGRFGRGADTIITISNPGRNRIKADMTLLSNYLGKGAYAFVSDQGQTLKQYMTKGKTKFPVDLAPKEIMVLRTIVVGGGSKGVVIETTRSVSTGSIAVTIDGKKENVLLSGNIAMYGQKQLAAIRGISDKDSSELDSRGFRMRLTNCGYRKLEIIFDNAISLFAGPDEITSFFTQTDALGGRVHIAVPDAQKENVNAEMLESYYAYAQAYKELPAEPGSMNTKWDSQVRIPVIPASQIGSDGASKYIAIGTLKEMKSLARGLSVDDASRVKRFNGGFIKMMPNNVMWIGGKTQAEVDCAMNAYLDMLDKNVIDKQ